MTTSPAAMFVRGRISRLLDDADAEAGEVVVLAVIEAGQLGGLATDERAARLPAALGDAADDARAGLDVERAGREVVEEEQRLGAGDEHVVDAHRDEVDADRVVAVRRERRLQLRADTIGAADEDRLLVAASGCGTAPRTRRCRREPRDGS